MYQQVNESQLPLKKNIVRNKEIQVVLYRLACKLRKKKSLALIETYIIEASQDFLGQIYLKYKIFDQ